ncbi:acyl carrier protein [Streptomyces sp. NPDC007083]|uniref:acyl carrier protein n=1 Tax=Streptomyces sp. NPDC007083 TaxID=3156913 RepID=UPI0033DDAE9B
MAIQPGLVHPLGQLGPLGRDRHRHRLRRPRLPDHPHRARHGSARHPLVPRPRTHRRHPRRPRRLGTARRTPILLLQPRLATRRSGATPLPPSTDDITTRLRDAEPGLPRRTTLEKYLADHVRAVLRLGNSALDPQTSLKALGFDSLLSMELRARLESELGVKLATNFVWQHPTLSALADGLAERMDLDI